jgi:hypothetical protein
MAAENTAASAPAAGPAHQPFQQAHEAYVKVLSEVCQRLQRQSLDHQYEFQTRLIKLNLVASQEELRAAQDSVREMMTAPPAPDPELGQAVDDAFTQYKAAIQSALRDADLATLDPPTLCAIGQSLSTAAQLATLYAPPLR